ncbi:hypothetical protein [Morganella morganii]
MTNNMYMQFDFIISVFRNKNLLRLRMLLMPPATLTSPQEQKSLKW